MFLVDKITRYFISCFCSPINIAQLPSKPEVVELFNSRATPESKKNRGRASNALLECYFRLIALSTRQSLTSQDKAIQPAVFNGEYTSKGFNVALPQPQTHRICAPRKHQCNGILTPLCSISDVITSFESCFYCFPSPWSLRDHLWYNQPLC